MKYLPSNCIHRTAPAEESLNCEPNDLLLWTPDKDMMVNDEHPLYNLRNKAGDAENVTLRDLPYKQLKELSAKLTEQQKEAKLQ